MSAIASNFSTQKSKNRCHVLKMSIGFCVAFYFILKFINCCYCIPVCYICYILYVWFNCILNIHSCIFFVSPEKERKKLCVRVCVCVRSPEKERKKLCVCVCVCARARDKV